VSAGRPSIRDPALVKPALIFSWFWIALLSLRELTIPIMLSRNETQTMSTAIWDSMPRRPYVPPPWGLSFLYRLYDGPALPKFVASANSGRSFCRKRTDG